MPQDHLELPTSSNGRIKFAVIAAPMLCGVDERLDALAEMYRQFPVEGVAHAIVIGPVFDPRENVNRGRAARFLADKYPQQKGVTTYALRHRDSPRSCCSLAPAMLAAGRTDWVDFTHPVVWLRHSDTEARVPLALVYDPDDESFELAHRREFKRLERERGNDGAYRRGERGEALVVALGGAGRFPVTEWRDGQMLSTVGVFSGASRLAGDHSEPVGCMVFDLVVANPIGAIAESVADFWDWSGTDLRRFEGCC